MSTSSTQRRIGRFHVVVVQWTSKKCTEKCDARAELLFSHKDNCFFFFCVGFCSRRHSCLRFVITMIAHSGVCINL